MFRASSMVMKVARSAWKSVTSSPSGPGTVRGMPAALAGIGCRADLRHLMKAACGPSGAWSAGSRRRGYGPQRTVRPAVVVRTPVVRRDHLRLHRIPRTLPGSATRPAAGCRTAHRTRSRPGWPARRTTSPRPPPPPTQPRTAAAMNSGPLSLRKSDSPHPRGLQARQRFHHVRRRHRPPHFNARHSRVDSSTTGSTFRGRPSADWSNAKSSLDTSFLRPARRH